MTHSTDNSKKTKKGTDPVCAQHPKGRSGKRGLSPFSPRGFTLIELMVSVAVLIGLMGMVAMIFSSAGKASGQAQATTALYRVVEQIAETIRQDLEAATPGESIMGIARVDVLAYATPEDAQTGRPLNSSIPDDYHRADMLMLVTKRSFDPYVLQPKTANDQFEQYRHVVYGHANQGKLNTAGTGWVSQSQKLVEAAASPPYLPASKWHLARRVTGSPTDATLTDWGAGYTPNRGGWPLIADAYTGVDADPTVHADVLGNHLLTPNLILSTLLDYAGPYGIAPGIARYDNSGALQFFFHRNPGGSVYRYEGNKLYCLAMDGADPPITDPHRYWWELTNAATPVWQRVAPPPIGTRNWDPAAATPPPSSALPAKPSNANNDSHNWLEWFYQPGTTPPGSTRTMLDPNPPPGRSDMMAAYFLPGCSDFKVEFTYDDPREIAVDSTSADRRPIVTVDDNGDSNFDYDIDGKGWLDLAPPYGTIDAADNLPAPVPQPIKWQSVTSGEAWVWNRIGVEPSDYTVGSPTTDLRDLTHPYRWPRAVRITLRVWDPAGRLPDPITHVIVHTFD